jgi:hypothetical protein
MADISFREMVPVPANVEGNCQINVAAGRMFLEKTGQGGKSRQIAGERAFF